MRRILLTVARAWTLAPGSPGARADEAPEDALPPAPEAAAPQAPAEPEPPKRADVPSVNDPEPEAEFMPSERIPAGSSVSFPVDI